MLTKKKFLRLEPLECLKCKRENNRKEELERGEIRKRRKENFER